jgi:hypothetical protein
MDQYLTVFKYARQIVILRWKHFELYLRYLNIIQDNTTCCVLSYMFDFVNNHNKDYGN